MRINCPYCGERGLEEFTYRGDATVKRPESLEPSAADAWVDYVYLRDNPGRACTRSIGTTAPAATPGSW